MNLKRDSLRKYFSVVLQDTCLFTGTIIDNIRYSQNNASYEDVINSAKISHTHDFMSKLPKDYYTMVSGTIYNLSQGQRQLIAIARDVLCDSPILILDDLTSFLFEVPSGAAADLFGRKKVMIARRICSVVSSVINLFAVNLFGFSIGFMISALGYNLNSGSEEALVYDTLKQEYCEKEYLKVSSRLNLIIEISQGLATFIGGVLAQYSYVYCYGIAIIISLLSLIPCCMFKEPSIKDENKRKEKVSIKMHFRICYEILKTNKKIIKVIVYFPLVFTFHTVVYFYGQQYFSILGCNKIEISFIMFFGGISSCIGALSCEKITYFFKDKTRYVASGLMGISIVFISGKILSVSTIFFCVMNYVNALLYPIQSEALNELIPSEQRATIISIDSMMFSFSMICMFPLSGLFADKFNLHITFFVLGITQILMIILLINKKNI